MTLEQLFEISRDLILDNDYYVKEYITDYDELAMMAVNFYTAYFTARSNTTLTFKPSGSFIMTNDKLSLIVDEKSTSVKIDADMMQYYHQLDTESGAIVIIDYILCSMSLCFIRIEIL